MKKNPTTLNGFDSLPHIVSTFPVRINFNWERKIYILKERFLNYFPKQTSKNLLKVGRKAFSRVIAHVFWSKTLDVKHTWHLTSYTSEVFYVVFTKVYLLNVSQYQSMSSSISFQTCELGTHCKQGLLKRTVQIQIKEGISSQVSLGDRLHLVLTSLRKSSRQKAW